MPSFALESCLVAAVGNLLLGLAVFFRRPRWPSHRAFGLLSLAIAVWNAGDFGYLYFDSAGETDLVFWHRILFTGSMAIAPAGFWLVRALTARGRDWTRLYARVLLGEFGAVLLLIWTPFFTENQGTFQIIAAGYQFSNLALSLAVLAGRMREAGEMERRRLSYLAVGGVIASALGITDYLAFRFPWVPRLGAPAILLYLCLVSAAIGRHGLFSAGRMLARWVGILVAAFAFAVLVQVIRIVGPKGDLASEVLAPLVVAVLAVALYDPFRESLRIYRSRARGESEALADRISAVGARLAFTGEPERWKEVLLDGLRAVPGMDAARYFPVGGSGGEEERPPRDIRAEVLDGPSWESGSRSSALAGLAAEVRASPERFNLLVPVHDGERMRGAIGLRMRRPHLRIEPEHLDILTLLGTQVGLVIQGVERLRWLKRQEEIEALAQMASGAAHEIKNPLGTIRGAVDLLSESPGDEPERFLRIIREEVDRLDRFLADFLAYGRPGSLEIAPLDLAALARETADAVALRPGGPAIGVEGDREAVIEGDRDRLRQVILNLLLNAREAAGPDGRVTVRVEAVTDAVVLAVTDTGPGIPPEVVPRLFRPFFSARKGGTGLGLAICARIVDLHGGRIGAGNRAGPETGAEFTVWLPCRGHRPSR